MDRVDIRVGGVLFVAAAETWRRTGHIWSPPFMAGIATLAIGLFHGRLSFNAFKAEWRDILSITTGERERLLG